jgi:cobyrinic acid a,c-diamide synthase
VRRPRGFIVAAPGTGHGKTVVSLGLLRAFRRRGIAARGIKIGPDFIDPAFHAAASGRPSLNLDHWAMRKATRGAVIAAAGEGADLVIAEGMMGLFDGAPSGGGSTADIAAETGWPVILVVDAGAQAQSIAALVRGFARFRRAVRCAGVVLTKVGGAPHRGLLETALAGARIRVFGMLGFDSALALPERHLGLVQAREQAIEPILERMADAADAALDLDALAACARGSRVPAASPLSALPPLGQRIAVADDAAFAFAYPHLLEGWRHAGAELRLFSPLADEAPPRDCDAVFLPGGYPELHAGRLAANRNFRAGLRAAASRGAFVYGECGGYMALGEALVDARGRAHAMLGLLPLVTSFAEPRLQIGYRSVTAASASPLGPRDTRFRGQEFHFARVVHERRGRALFTVEDGAGAAPRVAGLRRGSVAGSYIHLIDTAPRRLNRSGTRR